MKKFIATFTSIIYFISFNSCFASGNLYFIKNSSKSLVQPIVENNITNKKYSIIKSNPYLAHSNKNSQNYAVIILQTSGNNLFYYIQTNKNKSINNAILKSLKTMGITYEESFNTTYLSTFEKQALKVLNNTPKTEYNFSENTQQANDNTYQNQPKDNTVLKGYVGQVEKGSTMKAYLQSAINTANASKDDKIVAILTEDWIFNGCIIAPQGSSVTGYLSKAQPATYGSRNGRVVIDFNKVTTPEGKIYNISTEKIDFSVTNDGKFTSVGKNILVGATVGTLIGLLAACCSSSSSVGSAAAIGAGVGAGSAILGSTIEKGVDAEIPIYTEMDITLTKPLSVVLVINK